MLQQQQHHIRIRRFIIIVLITLYFKLLTFISRCKGTAISTFSQSHIYGIRIPQLWYFESNHFYLHQCAFRQSIRLSAHQDGGQCLSLSVPADDTWNDGHVRSGYLYSFCVHIQLSIINCQLSILKVYFLIHYFAVQNLEGI